MYQEYSRILAPIDGSDESKLAFKKAVAVASRNNATLIVAHIVDTSAFQTTNMYNEVIPEAITSRAKVMLDEYKEAAHKAGIEHVETVLDYGSAKYQLCHSLAGDYKADLIMLGATGLNAVERLFIGSVSEYVIRNAPCDVLVVRTDLDNTQIKHSK
ncbi:universal stress protein [Aerococcus sp. 1KP-2016]|uniref:universal stress protein n=1 Tax=Aerococcus sp. 1KP-2016 TaxID=1981982 RepID=UPI000B98BA6C|nr:universal stress protein [Aerococcus sp. 1KP-2016]OYQ67872.1 universal stress protein UspA [Aerococcus sp. 1KP-2016]